MGDTYRQHTITAAAFLLALLAFCFSQVDSTGFFEVRLHRFVGDGCCQDPVSFRICVKNYQASVDVDSPCIIGESVTGPHSLQTLNSSAEISFHFNFTWPGSFSLIIEAYQMSNINGEQMLSRFVAQRDLSAQESWHEERLSSSSSGQQQLQLSYRVKCETHYYGERCDTLCKPRQDSLGHYTCDARNGRKVCRPGWTNDYCDKAICRPGCHQTHGYCKQPYECICRLGWEGTFCDTCSRYPGCEHGTCSAPWQCNCDEGWGGLFCSDDLNYCTNNRPCMNGGTCTNTGQGLYTCNCSKSFMGRNCDVLKNPCELQPCQNGGTCANPSEGKYTCSCMLGYYGPKCETSADICTNNPCRHGGSCVHAPDGYTCACARGFFGTYCEEAYPTCTTFICQNNGTCSETAEGPQCHCPHSHSGDHCQHVVTCSDAPCGPNGKCVQNLDSYQCDCLSGFTGALCDARVQPCDHNPCHNGGTCHDLATTYRCNCTPQYVGENCSVAAACSAHPCRNGGTCRGDPKGGYLCTCPAYHHGRQCEYSLEPLLRFSNSSGTVTANVSGTGEQKSVEEEDGDDRTIVLVLVGSVIGGMAVVSCAICAVLGLRRSRRRRAEVEHSKHQNDLNNRCLTKKVVNTLERKMCNEMAADVQRHVPEKNLLFFQRTLERRDKTNGGSQDWTQGPPNSSGVFVIQDHIRPLKMADSYQPRPPSITIVDGEKVFATEV